MGQLWLILISQGVQRVPGTGNGGHVTNPRITNFVADALYRDAIRCETSDVMWIAFLVYV